MTNDSREWGISYWGKLLRYNHFTNTTWVLLVSGTTVATWAYSRNLESSSTQSQAQDAVGTGKGHLTCLKELIWLYSIPRELGLKLWKRYLHDEVVFGWTNTLFTSPYLLPTSPRCIKGEYGPKLAVWKCPLQVHTCHNLQSVKSKKATLMYKFF